MLLLRHAFDPCQHAGDLPRDEPDRGCLGSQLMGWPLAMASLLLIVSVLMSQENSLIGSTQVPCSLQTKELWPDGQDHQRHSWRSWSGERSKFPKRILKFPVRGRGQRKHRCPYHSLYTSGHSIEPRFAHL